MDTSKAGSAPEKVLVVDDEAGLRNMLKFGLQKRGYEVFEAEGGQQALELAKIHKFDLAVCDIMMPGMDGVQVLKALKALSPTIEVVMATGYATLETAVESMKQGASDYIQKPYSLGTLCTVFEKASEHRRLQAKVAYLEEVDRLKNEFMHTMNHELRTPLTSVMGYIALMREGVYGPINDGLRDAMNRAEVNAKYLLQLINGVLDFGKLQADRLILTPEVFHLKDIMQDVASVLEPMAAAKKLTVSIDRPENVSVYCDQLRLRQILLNLAGNAVKFTQSGTVAIQISVTPDDASVSFRVSDTGPGIAPEKLPLLFQEFKQLDGSDTRPKNGSGLGLAISKRLAEKMGGRILVQSRPAVGSIFVLQVPILHSEPAIAPLPSPNVAPAAPERKILAIDDDPDTLKLLVDGVGGAGFRVFTATNGPEGLALARKVRPDCILLDLMMPHMDGWQVLRNFKNDPALRNIPIYIVSLMEDRAKAFSMGVTGYIQKPVSRSELAAQLTLLPFQAQQIMVVEDDPGIRDVLTTALSAEGYDVISEATGEEALTRLKTLRPDVLFLDLCLPGISGFDILAALDDQPNRDKFAVFIMTAKELSDDEQNYLRQRCQGVVQKASRTIPELVDFLKKNLHPAKAAA
jgi:CheY-like chemotaxis protein/anti-sigma regulatory factor (Ser/Thr protein kinase)